MKVIINFLFFLIFFSQSLNASEKFSVIINGNDRISKETIIVFSKINEIEFINENTANIIYNNLITTDFFENVSIIFDNDVLSIDVKERPIVQDIEINGIKNKTLIKNILELIKTNINSPFVETLADNDIILIKNYLYSLGYYNSKISLNTNKIDNNNINLKILIDTGNKAFIKKISFIGDKKFKDRILRNIITSEESKFWKFLSKSKFLDTNRLSLDERLIKNFYLNNGFYKVNVNPTYAELLSSNNFEVTFNINSGDKYYFNNFTINLPIDYNDLNFSKLEKIFDDLKGQVYSIDNLNKIIDEIDNIALTNEFDFIESTFSEQIDNNKINITFDIIETKKNYVERVNIYGNNITNENVIRNRLIIDEGDPYNEILFNKAINNIRSSNLFAKVDLNIDQGKDDNYKIINIEIEEKPTGEISLGAGYGTTGSSIGFSIKENNFLGEGIKIINELNFKGDSVSARFLYNNPYYKNTNRAFISEFSANTTDKLSVSGYENKILSGSVGTNFEQFKNFSISPNINLSYERLTTNQNASSLYKKQEGSYKDLNLYYGIVHDLRDNSFRPKSGSITRFNQELPLYTNNASINNIFNFIKYFEFNENFISNLDFYMKTINSISSDDDVRVSKRAFLPSSRLRGFEAGKIGPKDSDEFIGGNFATSINFSTQLPKVFPDLQNVDFVTFVDAANLWGVDYDSTIDQSSSLRSSIGLAIDWFTPIGPLNFSLAQPLTKASSDVTETFRFNIGTSF